MVIILTTLMVTISQYELGEQVQEPVGEHDDNIDNVDGDNMTLR